MYCRCHRQTCRVCVDQRLAATEATCTGPCSAPPPKLQKHQKEGKRDYTASCGACRKPNTRASEREKKRVLRKEKRERGRKKEAKEVCKGIQREKTTEIWEEFERGSLVWQRRGFCIVRI